MIRRLVDFPGWESSLGFPTVFSYSIFMRMVGKRQCYFRARLEARRRFFWEQELASGELYASTIVCFTEHFMGLTTLASGYSKFFLENFK